MINSEYLKIKNECFKKFKDIEGSLDHTERLSFLQCISSKKSFFKENNLDNLSFYIDVRANSILADYEFNNYDKITKYINIESLIKLDNTPKIYCSFHYASYKLINSILNINNIDYCVVANKSIIEGSDRYISLHSTMKQKHKLSNSFSMINANSNSSLIQMIRCLKKGKSLLIYIDGGNGLQGLDYSNDKVINLEFLNKSIYSRVGIEFLSKHLNVPIIPVVSTRDENFINVEFYESINPITCSQHGEITKKIWDIFKPIVEKKPSLWEGNLYANHFRSDIKKEEVGVNKNQNYRFNKDIDFLKKDDDYFVYSYSSSQTFKLSKNLKSILMRLKEEGREFNYIDYIGLINEKLLKDLIGKKILI
ncbi:hypothetical protein [Myroides odoratus]|uniref:hypothetical protein n=1 Tax=Myroides odoratus TaxID=256 RepID=UPI0033417E32